MLLRFALFLLLLLSCAVYAADFSIREWTNDSERFITEVLEPTAEDSQKQGCVAKVDYYVGALLARLREIKTSVASKSYLLMREITLAVAEDLAPFEEQLTCEVLDRWAFVENHIRTKIERVGNMILIVESFI